MGWDIISIHSICKQYTSIPPYSLLPTLNGLLEATPHLGVRLALGQAIALLFELVREVDDTLLDMRASETAYELVQGLATESDRHTARKDRNNQRSTFKDLLNTLEVTTMM